MPRTHLCHLQVITGTTKVAILLPLSRSTYLTKPKLYTPTSSVTVCTLNKRYCAKEGDFITNLPLDKVLKMPVYQLVRIKAERGDLSGAMKTLKASPQGSRDLFLHPNLEDSIIALVPQGHMTLTYQLPDFGTIPQWDRSKALILTGQSGLGKTCLARALMPTALMISQIEDLRDYKPHTHQGIILDDMNFQGDQRGKGAWPREAQIHLVDFDYPRSIRLRYKNYKIPAGTSKIFTSNLLAREVLEIHDEAIRRRCTCWLMFKDCTTNDFKYTVLF